MAAREEAALWSRGGEGDRGGCYLYLTLGLHQLQLGLGQLQFHLSQLVLERLLLLICVLI